MSILKTLRSISKTLINTRDSVADKSDALDELLDKEYIYNAAQKFKDVTGDVVMEGGKLFQQAKDVIKQGTNVENLEDVKEKITRVTSEVKKSGEEILDRVTDKEAVYNAWEEAIQITDTIKEDIKKDSADLLADIKKNINLRKEEEE